MSFYKISAKMGHQGYGKHSNICFYVFANSTSDALQQLRRLPAVKKGNSFPCSGLKVVDEKEFILGNIFNQYYKQINSIDISEVSPLQSLSKRLKRIPSTYQFLTIEGQTIHNLCKAFDSATDDNKKDIEQKYVRYATELINKYSAINEFSFN